MNDGDPAYPRRMPTLIAKPTTITAAGNLPKRIDEYVGRVNNGEPRASGALDVQAGQGVLARAGEWIRYSSPGAEGAEYVAVCLPAFSPETVHRDG